MSESVASRPNAVRRLLAVTPGMIALYWIGLGLRTIWHAAEHSAPVFWLIAGIGIVQFLFGAYLIYQGFRVWRRGSERDVRRICLAAAIACILSLEVPGLTDNGNALFVLLVIGGLYWLACPRLVRWAGAPEILTRSQQERGVKIFCVLMALSVFAFFGEALAWLKDFLLMYETQDRGGVIWRPTGIPFPMRLLAILALVLVVVAYRMGSRAMIRWRLAGSPARPALYVGIVLAGVVLIGDRAFAYWRVRTSIAQLKHENPFVVKTAASTLAEMGPLTPDVIPALIETFRQGGSHSIRLAAAQALGRIGPEAKDGVSVLTAALEGHRVKWGRGKVTSGASIEAIMDTQSFIAVAEALVRIDPKAATRAGLDLDLPATRKNLPPALQDYYGARKIGIGITDDELKMKKPKTKNKSIEQMHLPDMEKSRR